MDTIALVGNPNSGKTTLFNAITGSNQHVGNWPGVTVEKKEGKVKYNNKEYNIVDLPGTYSLGAFSEDEIVARDFILKGNPDVVINVIDATNIERNLYLTAQLIEMGTKVVLALNMMDEAKAKNIEIDLDKLSKELGVPIVATIASKKQGIQDLLKSATEYINYEKMIKPFTYTERIKNELESIMPLLSDSEYIYPKNWLAIKILEKDKEIINYIDKNGTENLKNKVNEIQSIDSDLELEIIDNRYNFVGDILSHSVKRPAEDQLSLTDKIDKIVTDKFWGIPIFGLIMFIVFQLTFTIGEGFLGGLVEGLIGTLGKYVEEVLLNISAPTLLTSFIIDGIFGGVGAVLVFVPLIVVLYFFLGILEDTGYMARAAYVMDGIMRKLGLHGKTFISMIIGFGCNVPGIMATRTLENKKDRMIAILINPFMSCGARIPIYMLFIAAFFPNNGGLVLFSLYLLGIIMALVVGKIFSKTLFKGESSDFIMELPPYRLPSITSVLRNMWDKVWDFLHRAGTVIFVVVSLLWVLSILPYGVEPSSQGSYLGKIGTVVAPIFKPAGFGSWQAAVSLFSGIAAKEAVVGVLGMVYAAGSSDPSALAVELQSIFTPLTAVSFMVMVLFYTPCAATIATVKKETNSYKWAIFISIYTFIIGWISAVLVYQVGTLLGF
ncbi:ferrous iron transport protein B [Tissierella creatinophila]|uniref:Ferrous iron transport protein B n=1 Tax=Tissierella creatinophila DSM 6911 TaxID=1123403 RepID=A0A1U7M834_TISCR|nr:ferrous iron transport protein B [Tissierella creatinophila]OLS03446.1 ferrous iron transport protein B [Tissierella creatinophila DSM 6911]